MIYEEIEWRRADGKSMFAYGARPEPGPAKAVVCIVHGMGEHSGRYRHVAEMLTAAGYAVYAFDNYGHGRTEGKRGHTPNYEALFEGVDRMLDDAERHFPSVPKFLYGHSMGGNVTLNYLLRRKPSIAGAIVTGPWLRLAFQPPQLEVVLARIIAKLYPKYTSNRPLATDHLTSDPQFAQRIREDKLGHGEITAGFFFGITKAGKWALENAGELSVPLLLMHAGSDRVTSCKASRLFAEKAGSLCRFVEWQGFEHELHNEKDREKVFTAVREFLEERLAGS